MTEAQIHAVIEDVLSTVDFSNTVAFCKEARDSIASKLPGLSVDVCLHPKDLTVEIREGIRKVIRVVPLP